MATFGIGQKFAACLIQADEAVVVFAARPCDANKKHPYRDAKPFRVEFPGVTGKEARRAFNRLFWRYHYVKEELRDDECYTYSYIVKMREEPLSAGVDCYGYWRNCNPPR